MASLNRIPDRFPVGTKYVVEGRRDTSGAQVFVRYIEFPDGRHVDLADAVLEPAGRRRRVRSTAH